MRSVRLPGNIPIWFFVGVLLTLYGALIGGHGVYAWVTHERTVAVLANLHAAVWWGGMIFVLGLIYCIKFFPRQPR
jgi:integral membrane sensor domain MASE1